MSLISTLRKNSFLYNLNSRIKDYQLRIQLHHLSHYYEKLIKVKGFRYSEEAAIEMFVNSCFKLKPNVVKKPAESLNIFWVGASREQDNSGFMQALESIGRVTKFKNAAGGYGPIEGQEKLHWKDIRELNGKILIEQVKEAHLNSPIDILMGQMWAHYYPKSALSFVQSLGIPIITIAMDDRIPFHWSTKHNIKMGVVGFSGCVDIVLTTCANTCSWYGVEGIPAIYWPLASDPDLFGNDSGIEKDIDVLFVGNCYGIRKKIVDTISSRGISVACFGNGWPNGPVGAKKNIELSKRAKIILGIGAVGHTNSVYTLKLRDFDALMTGALYITHRNPDLMRVFREGIHLECYTEIDELCEKLFFYLSNDIARENIAKVGKSFASHNHSWHRRLVETFSLLNLIK